MVARDPNSIGDDDDPNQPSDAELLKAVESGERDAANEIYVRYAKRLYQLANKQMGDKLLSRVEAEDIVQSVFRTFFRRAVQGVYQIPEGDELWNLFLIISLNKIRKKSNYFRAQKRNVDSTEPYNEHSSLEESNPATLLQMTVDEIISNLPTEHQGVVRDRIAGCEVTEIATRNQLSRRTTERVLQNFRKRLEAELEVDNGE